MLTQKLEMGRSSSLQRMSEAGFIEHGDRAHEKSHSSENAHLSNGASDTDEDEAGISSDVLASPSKTRSIKSAAHAWASDLVVNFLIAFFLFLLIRPFIPSVISFQPLLQHSSDLSFQPTSVSGDWPIAPPMPDSEDIFDLEENVAPRRRLLSEPSPTSDSSLALTIFCAPKAYLSPPSPEDPQRRALLSWIRLRPQPRVVLFGNDSSFHALAAEFPGVVSVEPFVDANFYGVPLFHAMLARAQAAATPLSMLINGDIILLNDVMPAVQRVAQTFDSWIFTAARWDVKGEFPFSFEPAAWAAPAGADKAEWQRKKEAEIRRFVHRHAFLHTYGGVDLWVWNNDPPVPLFRTPMPPFSFGRGKYDNWFVHEAVASGLRHVVDGSDAVTSIHVAHSYAHVQAGNVSAAGGFWSTRKQSSWELFANIHMAESHGSYTNQKGTALHTPWKLTHCWEPEMGNMCLLKRERPAACSCEYSPYHRHTNSDPRVHKTADGDVFVCGVVSVDKKKDFAIQPVPQKGSAVGLPHTLEQLLPQVARTATERGKGGRETTLQVVTLVAVTAGYAEMLMNFVCNLRRLGVGHNLLIAALDEELYRFAFLQGLPVFFENVAAVRGIDTANCQFGTPCFRQFTKLKSRAVLHVLEKGYSVLWSDVDIVWFKDPLPELLAYGPGTLPIQSNEPNASLPGTGIRRINSGFYFARAEPQVVEAFAAIVSHAAKTVLSEQPSFYDVLCGNDGERVANKTNKIKAKKGREECVWTNGLRTVFLPREKYANGAAHGYWLQNDVREACKKCIILHNNWISGKDNKRSRMAVNGFWFYDSGRRMCIHPWHIQLVSRYGGTMEAT